MSRGGGDGLRKTAPPRGGAGRRSGDSANNSVLVRIVLFLHVFFGFVSGSLMARHRERSHEGRCVSRRRHVAGKDFAETHIPAIHGGGRICVLFDHGTLQSQASKYAFGTGVSQQLRIHFPVSASGCMTPHRAGRSGAFPAKLEFARKQVLQPLVIHHQHHQVDTFSADLKTPASAAGGDECGGSPARRGATTGNSAAVFTAENE